MTRVTYAAPKLNLQRFDEALRASTISSRLGYVEGYGEWVRIYLEGDDLSDEEDQLLRGLVAQASQPTAAEIIKARILAAMEFGKNLMADYGTRNVLAGLTTVEVRQVMGATQKLQAALLSGSMYVALEELSLIPLPLYSDETPGKVIIAPETVAEFRHRIQDFLGIPRS
jgi:hypothetical protein